MERHEHARSTLIYEEVPGADHFTIMNEMVSPTEQITTLIRQLFERTAS